MTGAHSAEMSFATFSDWLGLRPDRDSHEDRRADTPGELDLRAVAC